MQIEFLARFPKITEKENPMTEEDRELRRIINGEEPQEFEDAFTLEYQYKNLVLDIKDVAIYHGYDKEHCVIRTIDGNLFVLKCKYKIFKYMMEYMTGDLVRNINDFKFDEQLMNKAQAVSKILSEGSTISNPNPQESFTLTNNNGNSPLE